MSVRIAPSQRLSSGCAKLVAVPLSRFAAHSFVVACVLVAPVAQAECAKATVMGPCRPSATRSHSPTRPQARVRSPGLLFGGVAVAVVGVVGFGLAAMAGPPCTADDYHCDPAPPYFYGGIVTGVLGLTVGCVMIYYGAQSQTPQPMTRLPWTPPAARGMSLRFRF